MGTPCDEIRLMEKPQVKNDPASCQKASVRMAVAMGVRVEETAVVPGSAAAPSGARPRDSGESRTTRRHKGSMATSTASPISA